MTTCTCPEYENEPLECLCGAADRWNDGALDGCRNKPKAGTDPDYLAGYAEGQEMRKVQVVMPERPEGYYHQPVEG